MERGIPFEEKLVDLGNRPPAFVDLYRSVSPDLNASAKVPIFEHGEPGAEGYMALIESANIVEYLEDAFPGVGSPLRPQRPQDAVAVRMFNDAVGGLSWFRLVMGDSKESLQEALQDYAKGMRKVDRVLELYGRQGGDFVLGGTYSIAECLAAPLLVRGYHYIKALRGVDILDLAKQLECDRARRWMAAVLGRKSTAATAVDGSAMLDNLRKTHPEWLKSDAKLKYKISGGDVVF